MQVTKISNTNHNFNGWKTGATDRIWGYLMSHKNFSGAGIQKAIDAIEQNSPRHIVYFDAIYGTPRLKALPKKTTNKTGIIIVEPGMFFHKTLKGCLNKMNKLLQKENRRIETAQARKEAKAIKSIQIEEGIPPKVIPNFNK